MGWFALIIYFLKGLIMAFKKFLVEAKLLNMAYELPHGTSASDL